ncbi:hypothetical protein MOC26_14550 [Bacillus spizizenii]|uniref:hypothetical protein n=1 Tax=Bacillus inaquosorum TaxID=483913 RepID=UPI002281004A|nr:hypothetical protein [Bacillus inaquosorum]MCY8117871.1 hypothetical protein [Bacillus spizizenii]MCY7944497.1 hypothetical protein [Bacillus inaquosorum]MCY7984094.1 hypothetical protein [Bacillus inaquosorum]MCY8131456.1 hypothetical protein [Bacillus spizizenii]MCY9308014.1 hypothetical protein [Bacillus inaquosorum]
MDIKTLPEEKINSATNNPRIDLQPSDLEYDALKNHRSIRYIDPTLSVKKISKKLIELDIELEEI